MEANNMDLEACAEIRRATQRSRRGPREPVQVIATFGGEGGLGNDVPMGPVELTIEATNTKLEIAPWLADEWWTEVIQRWADCPVTVHIAPTPGALLLPVVLHQLQMLRRVTPSWWLVGHAYLDDLPTEDAVAELVKSPYHEVRFIDQPRWGAPERDRFSWAPPLEELFARIRREQTRLGTTAPVLVRLPSTNAKVPSVSTSTAEPAAEASTSPEPIETT